MGEWMVTALTANGMSFGERLSMAGTVTLEGMLVIFVVLTLLWGVIEIMHKLLYRESVPVAEKVKEVASEEAAVAEESEDDGATVAAIIAAIEAMRSENGESGGFRVVSFRKRVR